MKRILLLNLLCLTTFLLSAQNYYMSAPEGFAEGVTGGSASTDTPTIVTTPSELKSALTRSSAPAVILIQGTLTFEAGERISGIVKNKTILGLPGAKLVNLAENASNSGILNLQRYSQNVIIRNLTFEGPGAYDIDGRDLLSSQGCVGLWVDHCEFQDGLDGNFDMTNYTDKVTVSWCKFTYLKAAIPGGSGGTDDHRFSNLVGSSKSDAPDDGHYSITFMNNYWADGCKERMPRGRNAELHILNCYYNTNVSNSTAIGLGGGSNDTTCYVENTNFAQIGTVYKPYSGDGGRVNINFVNCLNGSSNVGPELAKPAYTYTTYPVEDVETVVTNADCGAGANLTIDENANISSTCSNLSVDENPSIVAFKVYPTFFDHSLFVKLPNSFSGNTRVSIYTVNGNEVFNTTKNISANNEMELHLNQLASGMYFCKVTNGSTSQVIKVMKK